MYSVYVLKRRKDENMYIGYLTDLKKRYESHRQGQVKSTEPRRPFELIFYEAYKSMADAKRREKYLKLIKENHRL